MVIKEFIDTHYRHFNAAALRAAAAAWVDHQRNGGKMFVTLAGAMSTAELGISLAALIRANLVHGICCTGANLEEDVFNLVAHDSYEAVPNFRNLDPEFEQTLRDRGLNRVTDTCIPEDKAIRKIEKQMLKMWQDAEKNGKRFFPHEFFFQLLHSEALQQQCETDPANSWLLAASDRKLPVFVPGWEDSTLGNIFVSHVVRRSIESANVIKSGLEYMQELITWYKETSSRASVGFFQIGGGIAGDFPICVVPLINQDLEEDCPEWSYFCQISDSTTSYGSYSGAIPSEKISWGKLRPDTPTFVIESDASIVAPLIFQYVLEALQ